MSPIAIAAILMLILLFLNVPVFASVLGACVAYFVLNPSAGLDGMLAMQRVISGMQSVPMLAIPFFVAAGSLMNYCGITERMLKFCKVLTGHMYGGLGQVNIALSTLMGGMSGSSLADAAMEAKLLVPDMRKAGYPNGYASAITAFFIAKMNFLATMNAKKALPMLKKCRQKAPLWTVGMSICLHLPLAPMSALCRLPSSSADCFEWRFPAGF